MKAHVLIPKKLYEAFFEGVEEESGEKGSDVNRVLQNQPPRYKKTCERLLNFVQEKGCRWNDKGEILVDNSQPLTRSNVLDLVRDSLYSFKNVPNKAPRIRVLRQLRHMVPTIGRKP